MELLTTTHGSARGGNIIIVVCDSVQSTKMSRTEKKTYLTFSSVNIWALTAEEILWYAVFPSSRLQPALMDAAAAAV